jgi:hypothetical protein
MVVLTISYGSDLATLTVVNRTENFVHVIVDGQPFLYVPPGMGVTHESEGPRVVDVYVFYSPGQGIHGSDRTTISVAPFRQERTSCGWLNGEDLFNCSTTPASGGPRSWEVTADSLRTEGLLLREAVIE